MMEMMISPCGDGKNTYQSKMRRGQKVSYGDWYDTMTKKWIVAFCDTLKAVHNRLLDFHYLAVGLGSFGNAPPQHLVAELDFFGLSPPEKGV